jgi:hypothetical protein
MHASHKNLILALLASVLLSVTAASNAFGQTSAQNHESARSDRFTGGRIERAEFEAGQPDIRITVNVPSFRLTLWQNNREVATYPIGVGLRDHPIAIGERRATEIIWNPTWIPPDSDWVYEMEGVSPGEVIQPTDPRNPLGKLKIPLGGGYLIHEARGANDLGNLVSHGCIRMLRRDLYDLAEKIVAARSVPVSRAAIERAKRSQRTLIARLEEPLTVDINYDTQVVEGGVLYLYPDVYRRGTLTVDNVRAELEASGVDVLNLNDRTIQRLIQRVARYRIFAVNVESITQGRALTDGRNQPLIARQPAAARRRRAR